MKRLFEEIQPVKSRSQLEAYFRRGGKRLRFFLDGDTCWAKADGHSTHAEIIEEITGQGWHSVNENLRGCFGYFYRGGLVFVREKLCGSKDCDEFATIDVAGRYGLEPVLDPCDQRFLELGGLY